jgi:hypothetical protein
MQGVDVGLVLSQGQTAYGAATSISLIRCAAAQEVDVDLVLSNGETVYGAITDNWPTVEPWFNETGSNCPSVLTRSQQMELLDLGIKAVQCMGFTLGVFHVELKNTSRGARLIEARPRAPFTCILLCWTSLRPSSTRAAPCS